MYISAVIIFALLVGGISFYLSVKLLKRFNWFFAWLRGSVGLILVCVSIGVVFAAWDLSHYDEILEEKPIASVSFKKEAEQLYTARVSYYIDKESQEFQIHGDQWQVDARIIRWTGLIAALGAKPGFKLDRISGRYFSLEDERRKKRSVFPLEDNSTAFDLWSTMQSHGDFLPGIDAVYGSAAYLPMADGATFQVSLSHNGLTAVPVNELAKSAIHLWR